LNEAAIRRCRWREPGGIDAALRIGAFLDEIGIELEASAAEGSLLPGLGVFRGRVRIDPEAAAYPGDLLHEAGHLAVSDPATRHSIERIEADPGDEMAAIAWSVAAAHACDIALEILFFDDGYRGGASAYRKNFADKRYVGVPMLAWFGMTAEPHRAEEWGVPAFPAMTRWLR